MRRIAVFREGKMMGAMIGEDLVIGLGGFRDTVSRKILPNRTGTEVAASSPSPLE